MQNEKLPMKGVAHLIRRNMRLLTQNIKHSHFGMAEKAKFLFNHGSILL